MRRALIIAAIIAIIIIILGIVLFAALPRNKDHSPRQFTTNKAEPKSEPKPAQDSKPSRSNNDAKPNLPAQENDPVNSAVSSESTESNEVSTETPVHKCGPIIEFNIETINESQELRRRTERKNEENAEFYLLGNILEGKGLSIDDYKVYVNEEELNSAAKVKFKFESGKKYKIILYKAPTDLCHFFDNQKMIAGIEFKVCKTCTNLRFKLDNFASNCPNLKKFLVNITPEAEHDVFITSMDYAFQNCPKLETADFGKVSFDELESFIDVFDGDEQLNPESIKELTDLVCDKKENGFKTNFEGCGTPEPENQNQEETKAPEEMDIEEETSKQSEEDKPEGEEESSPEESELTKESSPEGNEPEEDSKPVEIEPTEEQSKPEENEPIEELPETIEAGTWYRLNDYSLRAIFTPKFKSAIGPFDIDLSVTAFNQNCEIDSYTFYPSNEKIHYDGNIELVEDNTGDEEDSEIIKIHLDGLPSNINALAISLNICDDELSFKKCKSVSVALVNDKNDEDDGNDVKLGEYIGTDLPDTLGLMIGFIKKVNGVWKFRIMQDTLGGTKIDSGNADLLQGYCQQYVNGN